jgi:uncharacterized membrane protein
VNRLVIGWQALRASFWWVPALVVVASMAGAALLVEVDAWNPSELSAWSPRLFGAGAEGSRAMLSAIATSMVTVAGVVFSITIVALSLASSQYSPRVLHNFMRDRPTQWVLGVFLGIFSYCLMVLRTIRGSDEIAFIPALAVLGGMAYAFAGIALLIYFIHHVAQSIQASSILERIARDTLASIDHLFPEEIGHGAAEPGEVLVLPSTWTPVQATSSGYVVSVDGQRLMDWAVNSGRVLRLCPAVGDFVAEGSVLMEAGGAGVLDEQQQRHLHAAVLLGRQRTVEQDAAFGLQQLVDVAVKALSPGINDPTTACMCIDQLGALLARLAARRLPQSQRVHAGELRVIAPAPDLASLLALVFRPVLHHSRGDMQVLGRVVVALGTIGERLHGERRREVLEAPLAELRQELNAVRPRARAAAQLRVLRSLDQGRAPVTTRPGIAETPP